MMKLDYVVLTADYYIVGPYTKQGAKIAAGKFGGFAVVKKIRTAAEVRKLRR